MNRISVSFFCTFNNSLQLPLFFFLPGLNFFRLQKHCAGELLEPSRTLQKVQNIFYFYAWDDPANLQGSKVQTCKKQGITTLYSYTLK